MINNAVTAPPLPIPEIERQNESEVSKEKVLEVTLRIFSSPLFWAAIKSVILITFIITAIATPLIIPAALSLFIVGVGVISFAIQIYLLRKPIAYELNLLWNLALNKIDPEKRKWWDDINESIILGALPLRNMGHVEELVEKGVTAILSIVELFEFDSKIFTVPATRATWVEAGVKMKHISTPDYEPIAIDLLDEAVEYIHEQIENGKKLYVHCKSGKGRSPMAVICYLMKYQPPPNSEEDRVMETIAYVTSKRPQVKLDFEQIQFIIDYKKRYCSNASS